jgi:hypothetical protein
MWFLHGCLRWWSSHLRAFLPKPTTQSDAFRRHRTWPGEEKAAAAGENGSPNAADSLFLRRSDCSRAHSLDKARMVPADAIPSSTCGKATWDQRWPVRRGELSRNDTF